MDSPKTITAMPDSGGSRDRRRRKKSRINADETEPEILNHEVPRVEGALSAEHLASILPSTAALTENRKVQKLKFQILKQSYGPCFKHISAAHGRDMSQIV